MDRAEAMRLLSRGRRGVKEWNRKRREVKEIPNLKKADFRGADLRGADLSGANLRRTDLRRANLEDADLRKATLDGASLHRANLASSNLHTTRLVGADLSSVDLKNADLRNAALDGVRLTEASFIGANLNGARLHNAVCQATNFTNTNLSVVEGLETVHHRGPSEISTSTLVKSKGGIPKNFLKGCGFSDWQILNTRQYDPSLTQDEITDIERKILDLRARQGIQAIPLFISSSGLDAGFVDSLGVALDREGIRFWRDMHDVEAAGTEGQIVRVLACNPVILLVLSENSVHCGWIRREAREARELARKLKRDVLRPVALDEAWKSCNGARYLGPLIERYPVLDFSNWREPDFLGLQLQKLLEGLRLFTGRG